MAHAFTCLGMPGKVLKFYDDGRFLGYLDISATEKMLVGHTFCTHVHDRNLYQYAMLKAIEIAIAHGKESISIGTGVNPRVSASKQRLGFQRVEPAPEGRAGLFTDFQPSSGALDLALG